MDESSLVEAIVATVALPMTDRANQQLADTNNSSSDANKSDHLSDCCNNSTNANESRHIVSSAIVESTARALQMAKPTTFICEAELASLPKVHVNVRYRA